MLTLLLPSVRRSEEITLVVNSRGNRARALAASLPHPAAELFRAWISLAGPRGRERSRVHAREPMTISACGREGFSFALDRESKGPTVCHGTCQ
jgi:hypothetical protein